MSFAIDPRVDATPYGDVIRRKDNWTPQDECAFFFHEPAKRLIPYLGQLVPGDVCPVCGVLEDPYLTGRPVTEQAIESEKRAREWRRALAMEGLE